MRAGHEELAARRASVDALTRAASSAEISELLASTIPLLDACSPGGGRTASDRASFRKAIEVLEQFYRWDAAVQGAERHSNRFLESGRRLADLGQELVSEEDEPIQAWLREASALESAQEIESFRQRLSLIQLPLVMIPGIDSRTGPRERTPPPSPAPRAVLVARLEGVPLSAPMLVQPGRAYPLEIDARVLDWPDWAESLGVRFLSQWNGTAIQIPDVSVERPAEGQGGVWRGSSSGGLVVNALPAHAGRPIQLTFEAELRSEDRNETVEVIGYPQLELHGFDPSLDQITGSELIDKRVFEVFSEVDASAAVDGEKEAFRDLFSALTNEAQKLVANSTFRAGEHVLESDFQTKLLEGAQSRLGAANVRSGGNVAGGIMDIVYLDSLTAELKVERQTPVTLDRVQRYLGQPTQYAAGAGRQLSILCILDVTENDAPVGVLANEIYLFRPATAGLDDPAYPALVGVIVVRGGLPLPSSWSNRRVEADPVVQ